MNEETQSELSKIQGKELKVPSGLSIERFNKRNNKTTKLVDNEDESNFAKGANRDFEFELLAPTYVQRLEVHTTGYGNYNDAEFSWDSVTNAEAERKSKRNKDGIFSIVINDIIDRFSFKPDRKYIGEPTITKVVVVGLTLSELNRAMLDVSQIESYRNKIVGSCESIIDDANTAEETINTLESKQTELGNNITDLESEKSDAQSELHSLKLQNTEMQANIKQKTLEEGEMQSRLTTLDESIDSKKNQSQNLNQEIVEHERELKNLKNDINLFPSEIQGFVSQGGKNIARYTFLAAAPIAVLVYVTWHLFNNAADFAAIYKSADTSEIWGVFITRLPFVAISLGVIHACYKIAKIFIAEVININTQRLNLTKIAIIAKDVSEASSEDLDLSEDELYERRTKLKMDLLKSHLKGYIEDGYSYKIDPKKYEIEETNEDSKSEVEEENTG